MPLTDKSPIPLPTGLPRQFLSQLLVFGVACGLSAAPFLGAKRIPWFEPLVSIFPEEYRTFLIPISSLLIGLVALAIQFHAGEVIARRSIRKGFNAVLLLVLASVLALLILYVAFVKRIQTTIGDKTFVQMVVVGWSPLPSCSCPPGDYDKCVTGLASHVGTCWSDGSVAQVKISLFLSYLIVIEGFAFLVGLLVLRGEKIRQQRSPVRNKASTPVHPPAKGKKTKAEKTVPPRPDEASPPKEGG